MLTRLGRFACYARSARPASLRRLSTMSDSNDIPYTLPLPGGIPDTHRPHTERTTTILVPKENTAFLNPVQEYNRDLSVAVIRAWNELRKEELEARWRAKLERERKKRAAKAAGVPKAAEDGAEAEAGPSTTEVSFSLF